MLLLTCRVACCLCRCPCRGHFHALAACCVAAWPSVQICKAPTLARKLRVLIVGPGYRPTLHRATPPPILATVTRVRYSSAMSAGTNAYCLVQFVVTLVQLTAVLVASEALAFPVLLVAALVGPAAGLWTLGNIGDGRRGAANMELVRHLLAAGSLVCVRGVVGCVVDCACGLCFECVVLRMCGSALCLLLLSNTRTVVKRVPSSIPCLVLGAGGCWMVLDVAVVGGVIVLTIDLLCHVCTHVRLFCSYFLRACGVQASPMFPVLNDFMVQALGCMLFFHCLSALVVAVFPSLTHAVATYQG